MKMRQSSARRRAGFTLMEILLVLVILVVLAAAVIPNITQLQDSSMSRTAKVAINGLKNSIQTYRLHLNTYPPNLEALIAPPPELVNPKKWDGPYVAGGKLPPAFSRRRCWRSWRRSSLNVHAFRCDAIL